MSPDLNPIEHIWDMFDTIVISLSKRHIWITWRHILFKVQ
jgi:hypothetical protein